MKKLFVTFMVALFATVVLGQAKTEIKPSELPKCVHEYLAQNMKDYKIDKAFKQDIKGELTYMVIVTKGKDKQTLTFDKNCKAVNKAAETAPGKTATQAKEPIPPKPAPLPPVKTDDKPKTQPK